MSDPSAPSSSSSADDRPTGRGPGMVGRRVAQALYYTMMAGIVVSSTWQITKQVHFAPAPAEPLPYTECTVGAQALLSSVRQARQAATAGRDEEDALRIFRQTLNPIWRHQARVAELCEESASGAAVGKLASEAMDLLVRLRYAEEHGVRHQAIELSGLRGELKARLDRPPSR